MTSFEGNKNLSTEERESEEIISFPFRSWSTIAKGRTRHRGNGASTLEKFKRKTNTPIFRTERSLQDTFLRKKNLSDSGIPPSESFPSLFNPSTLTEIEEPLQSGKTFVIMFGRDRSEMKNKGLEQVDDPIRSKNPKRNSSQGICAQPTPTGESFCINMACCGSMEEDTVDPYYCNDLTEETIAARTLAVRNIQPKNRTTTVIPSSPPVSELPLVYTNKQQHFRLFGHGKRWTILALTFAWLGCFFAVVTRRSTSFVSLAKPIEISPLYIPVHSLGMIRVELCLNETISEYEGCEVIRLKTDEVNDYMFNLSRSLLALGTGLGFALTVVLSSSVYWETINLRPIGFGFLLTYFFQSFSMLFFDTEICNEHDCTMSTGGILCIITSLCWLVACVATAKMDSWKVQAGRARRRAVRRQTRELRKAEKAEQRRIELAQRENAENRSTEQQGERAVGGIPALHQSSTNSVISRSTLSETSQDDTEIDEGAEQGVEQILEEEESYADLSYDTAARKYVDRGLEECEA